MPNSLRSLALALSLALAPMAFAALEVGDPAPAFVANDDTGSLWSLQESLGEKNIVLYFYPAAMTGGCTAQACAFRDHSAQLNELDAIVVGVSGDSVNNLKLFKEANGLNFPLLSDPNGHLAELFGVPTREGGSIEREIDGETRTLERGLTTARWTFLIDKDGKVALKNSEVNAAEDSSFIVSQLQTLATE